VCDTFESGVWEPTINKRNSLRSATEAACLILSIDETVKNPQVCAVVGFGGPPHNDDLFLKYRPVESKNGTLGTCFFSMTVLQGFPYYIPRISLKDK